jgi:hypothetical protein
MSTQKRENRWQRMSCTERAGSIGLLDERSWSLGWRESILPEPAQVARYVCAVARGGTAPLVSILWSAWAWLATKFLQLDRPIRQLVRPVLAVHRRGSPLPGTRRCAALGTLASPRSSLPPIPFPSGFTRLHPTVPQAPDGLSRRAERYDGKRDLYFLHAA